MTRNCATETVKDRIVFMQMPTQNGGVDVPYVAVDDEPMHHELWRTPSFRVLRAEFPRRSSCLWHEHTRCTVYICITALDVIEHKYGQDPAPLKLAKGAVMCRDHSKQPLIHRATAKDEDVVMVGVEFVQRSFERNQKDEDDAATVFSEEAQVECVYIDERSRVDKFLVRKAPGVRLQLHTEAVLVALDPCELHVDTGNAEGNDTHKIMDAGHALLLQAGHVTLHLHAADASEATFYLVQVFQ